MKMKRTEEHEISILNGWTPEKRRDRAEKFDAARTKLVPDPTKEEIRAACAMIRSTWSAKEHLRRMVGFSPSLFEFQSYHDGQSDSTFNFYPIDP